jgi:hypothetical protein
MSYESRGFKVGAIAGVEGNINSPNKLGEGLLLELLLGALVGKVLNNRLRHLAVNFLKAKKRL